MADIDPFEMPILDPDPLPPQPQHAEPMVRRHVLDDPFSYNLELPFIAVGRASIGSMELVVLKVSATGNSVLHRFHPDHRKEAVRAAAFAAGRGNQVLLDGIQPASTMLAIEKGIALGILWASRSGTKH